MEIINSLISNSVKVLLGGFAVSKYQHQQMKNLSHEIKTVPHLDLDYQPITSNLSDKYYVIFSSISKINT